MKFSANLDVHRPAGPGVPGLDARQSNAAPERGALGSAGHRADHRLFLPVFQVVVATGFLAAKDFVVLARRR